jgi:hypothetical protein
MTQSTRSASASSVMLSGTSVRSDAVRLLATLLGGDALAQKLDRAVANGNSIVALSIEDRQRIVDVLEEPPSSLSELRKVLVTQLKKHEDKQRQLERSIRDRRMVEQRRTDTAARGVDAVPDAS